MFILPQVNVFSFPLQSNTKLVPLYHRKKSLETATLGLAFFFTFSVFTTLDFQSSPEMERSAAESY